MGGFMGRRVNDVPMAPINDADGFQDQLAALIAKNAALSATIDRLTAAGADKGRWILPTAAPARVRTEYLSAQVEYITRADRLLKGCESPIEQLLAVALANYDPAVVSLMTGGRVDVVAIEGQQEIEAMGRKYRADFLVTARYRQAGSNDYFKKYVVECDGHEYHERTKEQVEYTNGRARDLQGAGYQVVRFSGSEIYKSPVGCAKEIIRIVLAG